MLKKSKNSDELKTHREMYIAHCAKFGGLELPAGIHYTAGWNDASEILDAVVSLCQESDAAAVKRADEIERLKTELREISEAIDDPAINLTKTAVECINDLKLRIRLAEEKTKPKPLAATGFCSRHGDVISFAGFFCPLCHPKEHTHQELQA